MMKWSLQACRAATLLGCLLLGGCFDFSGGTTSEEKDPNLLRGRERYRAGDYQEALVSFEKALHSNPKSAAAHFDMAVVNENNLKNYIFALYYYTRFLELKPEDSMAAVVKERIEACKKEVAKTVSYSVVNRDTHNDMLKLAAANDALKVQVGELTAALAEQPQYVTNYVTNFVHEGGQVAAENLRHEVERARPTPRPVRETRPAAASREPIRETATPRQAAAVAAKSPDRPKPTPAPAKPSTSTRPHTLRKGDTLTSVSRQYGVSVQALIHANPGLTPRSMGPGQVIRIPAK
jgi:LysM repeat protein